MAELVEVSPQTINCIEGCRTWVSDKTLCKLAAALGVEVFQLLGPPVVERPGGAPVDPVLELQLKRLREDLKNAVDDRFDSFFRLRSPERPCG